MTRSPLVEAMTCYLVREEPTRWAGGGGRDTLDGGAGDDILSGTGDDSLDGGAGFDIVDYTSRASAVSITLGAVSQTTGDTFRGIEGVIGSAFADTLTSSTAVGGSAFLAGGAGADLIVGAQFNDVLQGGAGADTLTGGAGADKFVLALDGSVDTLTDFSTFQGDYLVLLDAQGAFVSGTTGLLIWDTPNYRLFWDPDSDAGAAPPVLIAQLTAASTNLETRSAFGAGFQPSAVRMLAGDGRVAATVFDWGNAPFDYTRTLFAHDGRADSFDTYFDNGAHSTRYWDLNATQTWDSRVADYDAQGRMTAYAVYNDNGSRQVFQYDVGGAKPWERLVESYDALGRISEQSLKYDDGTASERFIDTYDAERWAYVINNYSAAGALLNHTLYNSDGTVFTG